jgi:hypothetical protein
VICKASDVKEWNETSLATYDQLHQPSFEELCARLGHRNSFDTEGLSSNLNTPLPHVMSLSTALSYCCQTERDTEREIGTTQRRRRRMGEELLSS